jgi:hypothetical protein
MPTGDSRSNSSRRSQAGGARRTGRLTASIGVVSTATAFPDSSTGLIVS